MFKTQIKMEAHMFSEEELDLIVSALQQYDDCLDAREKLLSELTKR